MTKNVKKCRKVKEAFAELENEEVGIMVADAGRYGYVRLRYYDMTYGFAETNCFTESSALFNDLWTNWLDAQLFKIAVEDVPLMDLEYEDIFKVLPKEKQQELMRRRQEFARTVWNQGFLTALTNIILYSYVRVLHTNTIVTSAPSTTITTAADINGSTELP